MTDRPNPIVIHGLSIIAIFFLTVFAWNILESRGSEYFWSSLFLKGGFVLMVETILWSFIIQYARGNITSRQQVGSFLVDQLIFVSLIELLVFLAAHAKIQGLQYFHWVGLAVWVLLFVFWIISKRRK
jgi:hypothetical protein